MSLKIESMQVEDVDEVVFIDQVASAARWTPQMFLSELLGAIPRCFVAKNDGKIVGYLIFRMMVDEMHFLNVAIHPDFQRHGLGQALVYFAMQTGKMCGMKAATLEVRPSNLPAQRLYRKFGFQKVGVRKNYYRNPAEDAWILTYSGDHGIG
jgi:ribosomal-protein-alanine N-acetyltransferase